MAGETREQLKRHNQMQHRDMAKLRARVAELEAALERVEHAGSLGLAEDGCAWCLGEDGYTSAMVGEAIHLSTCPVGTALGRRTVAPPEGGEAG